MLIKSETSVNHCPGIIFVYTKKVVEDTVLTGIIWFLDDTGEACFTLSLG